MDEWNVESWNDYDDDESPAADDSSTDFDWDDDTIVTVKLADNEECPVCGSHHCLQNYGNQWLFLCLDCFHQFCNS
jgi:hypothetical protein